MGRSNNRMNRIEDFVKTLNFQPAPTPPPYHPTPPPYQASCPTPPPYQASYPTPPPYQASYSTPQTNVPQNVYDYYYSPGNPK